MKAENLTPIQKLRAHRIEVEKKCLVQETKLTEDFIFIRDNALPLISSGVSYILFPKRRTSNSLQSNSKNGSSLLSLDNIISLSKTFIPVIWEICKPILTMWSIKKIQYFLLKLISSKKDK